MQVVSVVAEGGRLEVPDRDSLPGPDTNTFEGLDQYITLMRRCWAQNPEDRPTFQEIIADLRDLLSTTLARGRGQGGILLARTSAIEANPPIQETEALPASPTGASDFSITEKLGGEGDSRSNGGEKQQATRNKGNLLNENQNQSAMLSSIDTASAYASTLAETGSLIDVDSLEDGWKSRLKSWSKNSSRQRDGAR